MINTALVVFIFQIVHVEYSNNRLSWVSITVANNHYNPNKPLIPEKSMNYSSKRGLNLDIHVLINFPSYPNLCGSSQPMKDLVRLSLNSRGTLL